MKMYLVKGITAGLSEIILSHSKKRAAKITELRKLGTIVVKTLDKNPKLRIAVNMQNEMLDCLEYKDQQTTKWSRAFTIDPSLYKKSVKEILKNK